MNKIFSVKTAFRALLSFTAMTGLFAACDDDIERARVTGFGSSELIASTSDVALSIENSNKVVLSFAWTKPTLLSSDNTLPVTDDLVSAALQASASSDFASYKETAVTSLSLPYTGSTLNALAKDLGLAADVASPVYFRLATAEGVNMDPAYSNVCTVNVTPFTIIMNELTVLNSSKSDTLTVLLSPDENGIYQGWMHATAWLNWWGVENDGTVWGNAPVDGQAFKAATASDGAWNFWFPDGSGDFLVTLDTRQKEWSCTLLSAVTVNGNAMTYDAKHDRWSWYGDFTAGTSLNIAAETRTWNYSTQTAADNAVAGTMDLPFTGNIQADGDYTVAIAPNGDGTLEIWVTNGQIQDDPEPGTPIPSRLLIFNTDKESLMGTMAPVSDGVFAGKMVASQWQNFLLYDADNDIWYGSDPADQFGLASKDYWNIWTNDDYDNGSVIEITADLNTLKWSYALATMPATLDLYDKEKANLKVSLQPTDKAGIYSAAYAAQQWENFRAYDPANDVWYGSDPSDQYALSAAGDSWDIWVNDNFSNGDEITLTFDLVNLIWSYTVGGGSEEPGGEDPDQPVVTLPSKLQIYGTDRTTWMGEMLASASGEYYGRIVASKWQNFLLYDAENDLWYGSNPSGQYSLSSADGFYNIWTDDDFDDGSVIGITANLNDLTWSYVKVTMPAVVYIYDQGKENQLVTLEANGTTGQYAGTMSPTAWQNFSIRDADNDLWYGSYPADGNQFKLWSFDGSWGLWFNDDVDGATPVTVTVDLLNLSWSYAKQ